MFGELHLRMESELSWYQHYQRCIDNAQYCACETDNATILEGLRNDAHVSAVSVACELAALYSLITDHCQVFAELL